MNILVPVTGVDPAPLWAQNIQDALFGTIDQHNHAAGNGVPIQPNGLDINTDLPFQSNNAIDLRSVRMLAQTVPISGPLDLGCIYVSGVDLYFNDENGNQIQLTKFGGVAGTSGSIGGLASPASATYVAATPSFVFQSNTNTPANLDGGSLVIRNILANSKGITINPPAALANNYSVTFPAALPSSQSFVTLDSSGNIAAPISFVSGITGSNIASSITLAGNPHIGNNLTIDGDTLTLMGAGPGVSISTGGSNLVLPSTVFLQDNSYTSMSVFSGHKNALYLTPGTGTTAGQSLPIVTSGNSLSGASRMLWGNVNSSGSITISSGGFTVNHIGTGHYVVSFNTSFNGAPSVVSNAIISIGAGIVASVGTPNAGGVDIFTFFVVTGGSTDSAFSFNAMGLL